VYVGQQIKYDPAWVKKPLPSKIQDRSNSLYKNKNDTYLESVGEHSEILQDLDV
jgi:hypothetical protein